MYRHTRKIGLNTYGLFISKTGGLEHVPHKGGNMLSSTKLYSIGFHTIKLLHNQ